jgi:malonate decarboxylase epsilon subunit
VSIAFTFPGQGAQEPGMLHRLPAHAQIHSTLSLASETLGEDLLALDSAEALASSRAVQLCLLTSGVAFARMLIAEGCVPDMLLGLSIGAFPAAVVAGALDFTDAVRLVSLRGSLMETAFPRDYGMSAVIGLDRYQVAALVEQAFTVEHPVFVANINAADQIVVAGHEAGLQRVAELALAAHAKQCKRIAISVPSHCALLDDAAKQLARSINATTLQPARICYISASRARALFTSEAIGDDLAYNMARQVHWHDASSLAYERGMRLALEMPPGDVLTKLTSRLFTDDGLALAAAATRLDTLQSLCARQNDNSV